MVWLNLLLAILVVLPACGRPSIVQTVAPVSPPAPLPTIVLPPTWTPEPTLEPTIKPSSTPVRSITLTPLATPAASIVFSTTDRAILLKVPGNWSVQSGQRQLLASTTQSMDYVVLSAPDSPPQPVIIIFYNWPAVDLIDNSNAWEQAYALTSLAIKSCPMALTPETASEPITISGQTLPIVPYTDACDQQGELLAFTQGQMNVGILLEAPQAFWPQWRSILHGLVGSIVIKPK